ncbi:MAG: GHMP kinase [Peptococcaceae bacterium]|nr:GHMP kinase [Peptococcaceae bacterium]
MDKFWVKTGARLHLGQLDLNGSLGRLYGGLGLAIDRPQLEITAEKSSKLSLIGSEEKRLEIISRKYLEYYDLPGVKIELVQSLPSHSGLGSGTQLSLALGFAITRVYGLQPSLLEIAGVTDRESSRSGIGVAAFEQGGFLVDGGKPVNPIAPKSVFDVPPILARIPFPEEWAIILALPDKEDKMSGEKEENAFQSLPPMAEEVSATICRLLVMKLLPGLMEKDLESFGQALIEIQKQVGTYFAPVQGGYYASDQGFRVAEYLLAQGATGVGQSSWGPAVYGFITREKQDGLLEKTQKFLGEKVRVWAVSGRNQGASWGWK